VGDETGIGARHQKGNVERLLGDKYNITGEGEMGWAVGIAARRNRESRIISFLQGSCVDRSIIIFRLENAHLVTTPLAPGAMSYSFKGSMSEEIADMQNSDYRELIGSLQYAALATRPNIAFTVNKLAQFLVNPGRAHHEEAFSVLRYPSGTKSRTLSLGGSTPDIAGYTDSDSASAHLLPLALSPFNFPNHFDLSSHQ
jgi:hypothetical protein